MTKTNDISNIRGVGHLTIDAVKGVTDIAEDLQESIITAGGLFDIAIIKDINKIIFNNIRLVSKITGASIDLILKQITTLFEETDTNSSTAIAISILNGVLGDHLKVNKNPLEIKMKLFLNNQALFQENSDNNFLKEVIKPKKKIVLMVHGSCMNHIQWTKKDCNYADNLEKEFGYHPLYLNYNTGLHISENGKEFNNLMEKFIKQVPESTEITIIGYSMGGLVTRSALHYGKELNNSWVKKVKKVIFIAVPHSGAVLERRGNLLDNLAEANPYTAPFSRLWKIRSSGITDLRFGNLIDSDWQGVNRFEYLKDRRTHIPLPKDMDFYAIAGTITNISDKLNKRVLGDGLVTLDSAFGINKNPDFNLEFPEDNKCVISNINHLSLTTSPKVYEVIRRFILEL